MKHNIKTKISIIILVLFLPFICVYTFAALTMQPQFEVFVREAFSTDSAWLILSGIYWVCCLCSLPAMIMWVIDDEM